MKNSTPKKTRPKERLRPNSPLQKPEFNTNLSDARQLNPSDARQPKPRPRSFTLAILLLSAVLCLTVGIIWLLSNMPGVADTLGWHEVGSDHTPVTLSATESTVPYTQMIAFSSDPTLPLYGKLIFLDPGHGGSDSGCAYPTEDPLYIESQINLMIANMTRDALEARGATVVMIRSDDSWVSLYHRIALTHLYCIQYADQCGLDGLAAVDRSRIITELSDTIQINSDTLESGGMGIMSGTGVGDDLEQLMDLEIQLSDILYISVHANSNPDASTHGTQVYYVTDASVAESESNLLLEDPSYLNNPLFPNRADYDGRDEKRNKILAQSLYNSIIATYPDMETNAASTVAGNYAVLRENNLTSALIEVGFISNKEDRSILADSESLSAIASGIAEGCILFYSEES